MALYSTEVRRAAFGDNVSGGVMNFGGNAEKRDRDSLSILQMMP